MFGLILWKNFVIFLGLPSYKKAHVKTWFLTFSVGLFCLPGSGEPADPIESRPIRNRIRNTHSTYDPSYTVKFTLFRTVGVIDTVHSSCMNYFVLISRTVLYLSNVFFCVPTLCDRILQIPTPASKVSGGSSANSSPSLRYLAQENIE